MLHISIEDAIDKGLENAVHYRQNINDTDLTIKDFTGNDSDKKRIMAHILAAANILRLLQHYEIPNGCLMSQEMAETVLEYINVNNEIDNTNNQPVGTFAGMKVYISEKAYNNITVFFDNDDEAFSEDFTRYYTFTIKDAK